MKNRIVYVIAIILIAVSLGITKWKVAMGEKSVDHGQTARLWRINIVMNLIGSGNSARARLTLPEENDRQVIYNEHSENNEMVFYTRVLPSTKNRAGYWKSDLLDGFKSVQYTFSAQLKSKDFFLSTADLIRKNPKAEYPPELVSPQTLEDSKYIQAAAVKPLLKKVLRKEKTTAGASKKIYEYIRSNVVYKSEKGSKDAQATLEKMVADCGGMARLFVAFSRAAGIPSRIAGGLLLDSGMKNITHVWAENYIAGDWIPFDVVNGHVAKLPAHYLQLYRGDVALIRHTGLKDFKYVFIIGDERVPPLDNPWSMYVIPAHFQNLVKSLLLIPIGALIVAFCRIVIGIPTFGTFTPILLALAFREVSLSTGFAALFAVTFVGWSIRKALDGLKILVIPRLAIILTIVVICVLSLMIIGLHSNYPKMLFISLFPIVIMTWMIERFSVLEIEDGTKSAVISTLGSAFVSAVTYFVFSNLWLRKHIFVFPESLLIVIALLLVLGRYTGMRVTELWRFRDFLSKKKINL